MEVTYASAGWANSILKRMGFVRRKGTTQKCMSLTPYEFAQKKEAFLNSVSSMVNAHNIPPELVLNWDQGGTNLMPSSSYTLEKQGATRVEIAAVNDKKQIAATFAVSLSGAFLPFQLLYQGKTERCHPKYEFPPEIDVWHSPNHWSNQDLTKRFVEKVIIPYVIHARQDKSLREDAKALVIFHCFSGHQGPVLDVLESHNIVYVFVPDNCTDRLQPLDVSVNKPVKDHLRSKFRSWYADEVSKELEKGKKPEDVTVDTRMSVVKEISAKWIVSAYDYLKSKPDIIINGFKKAGIVGAIAKNTSDSLDFDPFSDLHTSDTSDTDSD